MKSPLLKIFLLLFPVLIYGQTSRETGFIWKPATSGSQRFEKAVMLVPVRFPPDTTSYFLQFDTGATNSVLYSNRLKGSGLSDGILQTSIGKIRFAENESIEASDQKNAPVGTLGADFLKDRIVRICYVDQTISIDLPYKTEEYSIEPLTLLNGRPVVSVSINGKERHLLYDTGSSLFGIWTTKRNWNKLRDKDTPTGTFLISSWGKVNPGFYSEIDSAVLSTEGLDKQNLKVWYVGNRNFKRFFRRNDLFGILGNQPFLNKEILLDFRKNLFGIRIADDGLQKQQ